MSAVMTAATQDELQKVSDVGLTIISALANQPISLAMSTALCDWLAAAIDAECRRRNYIPADHPALKFDAWSGEVLGSALALSFCLTETAMDPLAQRFLNTLHKGVIGEVCCRLISFGSN